jgi:16S rRNA (guanine527-N7)-methyltransferase
LKQAISVLGINAKVLTQRVEQLEPALFQAEGVTVTARAFAPLARMLEWTDGFGSPATRALLHKGRDYQTELAEVRGRWTFDLIERPSLVDSASVILDITAVKRL